MHYGHHDVLKKQTKKSARGVLTNPFTNYLVSDLRHS